MPRAACRRPRTARLLLLGTLLLLLLLAGRSGGLRRRSRPTVRCHHRSALLLLLHRISTYILGFEPERRVGGIVAPRVQLGGQPLHHAAPPFGLCIARRV